MDRFEKNKSYLIRYKSDEINHFEFLGETNTCFIFRKGFIKKDFRDLTEYVFIEKINFDRNYIIIEKLEKNFFEFFEYIS